MGKEQRQLSVAERILALRKEQERKEKEQNALETARAQAEARDRWEKEVAEARRIAAEIQKRNRYFEDIDKKYNISGSLREINKKVLQERGIITISSPYGIPYVYDNWDEAYRTSWKPLSVCDAEFSLETSIERAKMTVELSWDIDSRDSIQLPSWGPRLESDFLTDEVTTRKSGNTVRAILNKDNITILGGISTAFRDPYTSPMVTGPGSGQQGCIGVFYPGHDLFGTPDYLQKLLTGAFENSHWIVQSMLYNRRTGKPRWL